MNKYISKLLINKFSYLKFSLSVLVLIVGIGNTAARSSSDRNSTSPTYNLTQDKASIQDSNVSKGKLPATDGIYLYSQSPKPNQLGQEYAIFEMRQGKVTGAFYLPQSEFSCFQGSLTSGKLAVTIVADANSESDAFPDSQQVAARTQTEGSYGQIASPYVVKLQNYYQLSNITASERQILSACQQNYQQ